MIKKIPEGWLLRVYVSPNASKSAVVGMHGDRLKIKVHAAPTDGKANLELLRFLKNELKVKLQELKIIRGETSKQKDILVVTQSQDVFDTLKQKIKRGD